MYSSEYEIDTTETEVEVACLSNLLVALGPYSVEAVFILGPDINSADSHKRALRSMHPWNLYGIAKGIADCEASMAEIVGKPGSTPRWSSINEGPLAQSPWAEELSERGYASVLAVSIPIAMERHFECILLSRRPEHQQESAGMVALETLAFWPRIKQEIACKQQLLNLQEQKILRLSAMGATSLEAARRCDTTERMINFHIGNSLRKLGAQNKTAAVLKAILMGVL